MVSISGGVVSISGGVIGVEAGRVCWLIWGGVIGLVGSTGGVDDRGFRGRSIAGVRKEVLDGSGHNFRRFT